MREIVVFFVALVRLNALQYRKASVASNGI